METIPESGQQSAEIARLIFSRDHYRKIRHNFMDMIIIAIDQHSKRFIHKCGVSILRKLLIIDRVVGRFIPFNTGNV